MSKKKSNAKGPKFSRLMVPLILTVGLLFAAIIYAGSLTVLYPNGGEILKNGTNVHIKWQSQDLDGNVVIVLYKKGVKHSVISEQTVNNGTFLWKIPANLPEGNDYRIRIRAIKDLSINDFSDRDFTIKK